MRRAEIAPFGLGTLWLRVRLPWRGSGEANDSAAPGDAYADADDEADDDEADDDGINEGHCDEGSGESAE